MVTPPDSKSAPSCRLDLIARGLRFTAAVGARHMLLCTFFASNPDTPEKKQNLLNVVEQLLPLARNWMSPWPWSLLSPQWILSK